MQPQDNIRMEITRNEEAKVKAVKLAELAAIIGQHRQINCGSEQQVVSGQALGSL